MAVLDWNISPFASLEREFDRLRRQMDSAIGRLGPGFITGYPPMNIHDSADEVVVTLLTPGLRKEDLSVDLRQNALTITGKREAPGYKDAEPLREECVYGEFQRTVRIEARVQQDRVEANLRNGILSLRMPKSEDAKPKKISINT
jgi:HSP20 family protein